jgi:LysM repeat protein
MLPVEDRVSAPPPPPPSPPAHAASSSTSSSGGHTEVVHAQSGDRPVDVARRYGVHEKDLRDANPGLGEQLAAGQALQLPPLTQAPEPEPEPQVHKVQPGDTLSQIARHYDVRLRLVIEANPGLQGHQGQLTPGESVLIPAKPQQPPATPQAATDRALKTLHAVSHTLDQMNQATQGTGAALPYLRQQVSDAQLRLKSAVQTEVDTAIAARHGDPSDAQQVQGEAQALLARHPGDAASQAALKSTLADIRTDREVAAVMKAGAGQRDPAKALQAINGGFAQATPQARARLLQDPELQSWITAAAATADAPLAQVGSKDTMSLQAPAYQAAQRLDDTTRGLDPELAGAVTAQALPGWEAAQGRARKEGMPLLGMQGTQALSTVASRVADSANGGALVRRLVSVGLDSLQSDGLRNAVAMGAGPAYLVEVARQVAGQSRSVDNVLTLAEDGIDQYKAGVDGHVEGYAKEFDELNWLVSNHGGAMTPEQLNKAINDYAAAKGPEWQHKLESQRNQLTEDGANVLRQLRQLQNLPPELAGRQKDVDAYVNKVLEDPKAHLAISMALQQNPELATGGEGQATLNFFARVKLGDQGRRLGQEFATAYVKGNVLGKLTNIDRNDPASLQQARDAVAQLKNSNFAKLLGVKPGDLDNAVKYVDDALPQAGDTPEQAAARLKTLDDKLQGMAAPTGMKAFDKGSLPGQLLRTVGLAAAGVGLVNSANKALDDPSLKNDLKVLVDAAGLGQKGAELLVGLGRVSEESRAGRIVTGIGGGWKVAGRVGASEFLGVVGSAFDVWNAVDSVNKGDGTSAALYGTGAAGGLMAALGSGSAFGPIGIGLVVVSAVGLAIWNHVKEANAHENDTSARFLAHSGLDAATSKALVDQSGDGYSPVPAVLAYANSKGLNQAQTVRWLEGLQASGKLGTLRDEVHHMLDDADGDAGKFKGSTSADQSFYQQLRPRCGARGMQLPEPFPKNFVQLDSWMRARGIATP